MGFNFSKSASDYSLSDTAFEKLSPYQKERFMLAKILKFDVNLGKKPILTIARRFARENTNDLGWNLLIGTSDIVIIELKKFFLLCYLAIKEEPQKYKTEVKSKVYYRAPFPAPVYIEKAWDLFILYTEHYEQFCDTIFGGWLDKYDSSTVE